MGLEHDPASVKLGKRRGVVKDPRTLRAADFIEARKVVLPGRFRVGEGVRYPVFANNRYGDCAWAAAGHQSIAEERASGQKGELAITTHDIIHAYKSTGFDPKRPETDRGTYLIDALNYRRKIGIGHERDGTRHTIGAFALVDTIEVDDLRRALFLFGGLYIGLDLPRAAQRQKVWDMPPDKFNEGDYELGSWGGHCIFLDAYNAENGRFAGATWGTRKTMTGDFLSYVCDEAYAVVSEDYFTGKRRTPAGLDVKALEAELRRFG